MTVRFVALNCFPSAGTAPREETWGGKPLNLHHHGRCFLLAAARPGRREARSAFEVSA